MEGDREVVKNIRSCVKIKSKLINFMKLSPVFCPCVSSSALFAPSIARLRQGSGWMLARSNVELACRLAVESVG